MVTAPDRTWPPVGAEPGGGVVEELGNHLQVGRLKTAPGVGRSAGVEHTVHSEQPTGTLTMSSHVELVGAAAVLFRTSTPAGGIRRQQPVPRRAADAGGVPCRRSSRSRPRCAARPSRSDPAGTRRLPAGQARRPSRPDRRAHVTVGADQQSPVVGAQPGVLDELDGQGDIGLLLLVGDPGCPAPTAGHRLAHVPAQVNPPAPGCGPAAPAGRCPDGADPARGPRR